MATCRPISGLKLDDKSKKMLISIKKKGRLQKVLATALATGVVSNIFTKNALPVAAINVKNTDWTQFATAMESIPRVTKRAIRTDVESMIFDYEMDYNAKLLAFWKGILNGCK